MGSLLFRWRVRRLVRKLRKSFPSLNVVPKQTGISLESGQTQLGHLFVYRHQRPKLLISNKLGTLAAAQMVQALALVGIWPNLIHFKVLRNEVSNATTD